MREVVLDTETTGLDPRMHKVVEIACLELDNGLPTGNWYRRYVNPGMRVSRDAFNVHGIANDLLDHMPMFQDIQDELLTFLGGDPVVAHNAPFDVGFLQMELQGALGNPVVDTLALARQKHPGAGNSLDALCRRYRVENARKGLQGLHGALVDCEMLAQVYLHLIGGQQRGMELERTEVVSYAGLTAEDIEEIGARPFFPARPHEPTLKERQAHQDYLQKLREGSPVPLIWDLP